MKSVKQNTGCDKAASFGAALLGWYDRNARVLPWRYTMGERPDPYRVWLSEIMLQQTTVTAVIPYFQRFTVRWPDVHALARAEPEALMAAWAGLGYYARARNLLACARTVSHDLGGAFPEDEKALRALPGIGEYTSAAIRAIAFNKPAVVVDGNVERVIARVHTDAAQNPKDKRAIKGLAEPYYDYASRVERPGDLAQAFMDLGAGVCTPKAPRCGLCPVSAFCGSVSLIKGQDSVNTPAKPERRKRFGQVYWIEDGRGRVLLHRRPPQGLLGGMVGLPVSPWSESAHSATLKPDFLVGVRVRKLRDSKIIHPFTHFILTLEVYSTEVPSDFVYPDDYFWYRISDLDSVGLPSVFVKVVNKQLS